MLLGDSLAARMPVPEGVANRGRAGDTVAQTHERLAPVLETRPDRLVLLVGANDLLRARDVARTAAAYERLLRDAALTPTVVLSVLPMRSGVQRRIPGIEVIEELNRALAELAAQVGARFVDLRPPLADADRNLNMDYSGDGIHLNADGYAALAPVVSPLLDTA